jgi:hypothetical protein
MKAAHAALYNKLYEMMEDDDWVHAALAADGSRHAGYHV